MSDFMIGPAAILGLTGVLLIYSPGVVLRRNGMEPQATAAAIRTYRIGGGVLIFLAVILVFQLLSE